MRRLLLVDDEKAICLLLRNKLSLAGFESRTCFTGEDALAALQEEPFDLIISDLQMPGISGLELLPEVRKLHPYIAFIMATGVSDVRIGVQAMQQGADDYILKPFVMEAVVASIERALERKRLQAEVDNYRKSLELRVEQRTKQLQAANHRIEMTYDETLEALGAALDLRDTETEGHSRRVSAYCQRMAHALGYTNEQLKHITRGSYLHDIGKIGIPDSILLKPGRLTGDETAVMQTHALIGYNLVSRILFLAPAAEIVLTHQECYDGTGYPQGLSAEEIPLGSRIFAVADTLDAMTSDRPYRRALPFAAAREEVVAFSGHQFDPQVVQVFVSTPEKDWESIRSGVARYHGSRKSVFDPLTIKAFEKQRGVEVSDDAIHT